MFHHFFSDTQLGKSLNQGMDALSAALTIGTLAHVLPSLAALGAVIWYALAIYDWVITKIRGPKK